MIYSNIKSNNLTSQTDGNKFTKENLGSCYIFTIYRKKMFFFISKISSICPFLLWISGLTFFIDELFYEFWFVVFIWSWRNRLQSWRYSSNSAVCDDTSISLLSLVVFNAHPQIFELPKTLWIRSNHIHYI